MLCLAAFACLAGACVSRHPEVSSQDSAPSSHVSLDGIWRGDFDIEGRGPFDFTALHVNGKAYAYSRRAGALYAGSVERNGEIFTSTYTLFLRGGLALDVAVITGEIKEENRISSRFVTMNGRNTGTLDLVYDAAYDTPSSLDRLSGVWSSMVGNDQTVEFQIDSRGRIQGHDSGNCGYQGKLDIINPAHNAYEVEVRVRGCKSMEGDYEGVSFMEGDWLNVLISNANRALLFQFSHGPYSLWIDGDSLAGQSGQCWIKGCGSCCAILTVHGGMPHNPCPLEGYPSGQREQTVNLPAQPSEVRILPPPPFKV